MAGVKIVFVDGTQAQLLYGELTAYNAVLTVLNPEAFQIATPTPAGPCKPVIGNYTDIKPGETLAPTVTFVDANGLQVTPLSSVLYINGKQTSSIIWDGKKTNVTVQYTCPDNSASEKSITIPAYSPTPKPQSENQPDTVNPTSVPNTQDSGNENTGGLLKTAAMAGGIIAGLVGTIGAAISGGFTVAQIAKPAVPKPPISAGVSQPVSRIPVSEQLTHPKAVKQPPPEVQSEEPPQPKKRLTPEQRINLETIRNQMQTQINIDRTQFNQIKAQRSELVGHLKRNLLKFTIKQANETREWITLDPIKFGTNLGMKQIWDSIYGNEGGVSDSEIILRINSVINKQNAELSDLRKNVIHLKNEIEKINSMLAGQ